MITLSKIHEIKIYKNANIQTFFINNLKFPIIYFIKNYFINKLF